MLQQAIAMEEEGIAFYTRALKIVRHDLCVGVITILLEQEKKHIEEIRRTYDKLQEQGSWSDPQPNPGAKELEKVFTDAMKNIDRTLKPSTDERELLEQCMKFEQKGKELYLQLSEKAQNPHEKEFYRLLSREEEKHFAFLEQYCNYYWDMGLRMQE